MRRMSIRSAVILPFSAIMLFLLIVVGVIWRNDYNWLVEAQGERLLSVMGENTVDRLSYFLQGPKAVAEIYGNEIKRRRLYSYEDLSQIETFSKGYYLQALKDFPQISTIGYGDEQGNYFGFRYDDQTKKINLMLKDRRTKGLLNIYEGDDIQSRIAASYEGYDPRVRPWYAPVKNRQVVQWSDVYINYDEKKESTLSILIPLIDEKNDFKGVIVADVKLNGINEFLRLEQSRSGGALYIMDERSQIIGHSEDRPVVVEVEGTPPAGRLIQTSESENLLIKLSALKVDWKSISKRGTIAIANQGQNALAKAQPFEESSGLRWAVVVVLPLRELMGDVINRQLLSLMIISATMILGLIIGLYGLNRMLKPIVEISHAIAAFSRAQEHVTDPIDGGAFKETIELADAFNEMAGQLNAAFTEIKDREEQYRLLVESSEDLIFSLSTSGQIITVNESFERISGQLRDEWIGRRFSELLQDEPELIKWENALSEGHLREDVLSCLNRLRDRTGRLRTYTLTIQPVKIGDGHIVGYAGTNHDITTLLEIESEKVDALSFVVSGLSHEINTPIGNSITMSTYLLSELDGASKKLETGTMRKSDLTSCIKTSQETCQHLIVNLKQACELVESFKDLAVNKVSEIPEFIKVEDVIKEAFNAVAQLFPEVSVKLSITDGEGLVMRCERSKLLRLFTELVENSYAHGFYNRGSGCISIVLRSYPANQMLGVEYRDDGVGVPEDERRKVFTPFYSSKFGLNHSGLGLNVIHNIVKSSFDGEISLGSHSEGFLLNMSLRMERQ